jgi:parvulin-like peptidyl-prolyl isomerase
MRQVIVAAVMLLFLLAACSSHESAVKEQETVKLFVAINDEYTYSQTEFSDVDAAAISDLVKAECPQGVGEEFLRATLVAPSMTLVLYLSPDGEEVTCSVLKPKDPRPIEVKAIVDAPEPETAVTVNGQTITNAQVRAAVERLPQDVPRDVDTLVAVINQLINDELLRQAAKDVEVDEEDITTQRTQALAQAGLTEETLPAELERQGVDAAEFDRSVVEQARLAKLLKERILLDTITVTEEDARDYYLANTNQFIQSEQAVARFIIIAGDDRERVAREVSNKLASEDFCALVREYSVDDQSKENCGVYVVPRGVLNPEVEQAAFGTPQNQTALVDANDRVFLVQTLQVTPTQVVPYAQASGSVQTSLRSALIQQRLNLYSTTLRHDARIVSYLN